MRFAKWVFRLAGLWGVLILVPLYFFPPPRQPLEYYFGFLGVALAWQILFLVIATDPIRYRPAMPPAMLEKLGFVLAIPILVALGRVDAEWLLPASLDATWLVLFVLAWWWTPGK